MLNDSPVHAERLHTLVRALAAGDDAALSALYKLTVPLLYSFVRRVISNAADAEEVICDVYAQVWRTAAQYDVTRGPVTAWLIMICRSRAIDRYRQDKCRSESAYDDHRQESDRSSAYFEPENSLHTLNRGTAIRWAMSRLSPLRRRLLALAFFQGLSHHEIAASTELALGTVKSHIRRSLTALRQDLMSKDLDWI